MRYMVTHLDEVKKFKCSHNSDSTDLNLTVLAGCKLSIVEYVNFILYKLKDLCRKLWLMSGDVHI